jgi:Tfp pilus assembly protein PilF
MTPDMQELLALLNAGRFPELEHKARALLKLDPAAGVLWQVLAVSLEALTKAAQLSPNDAGAQNNLGNALGRCGQLTEATTHYRRALQLNPAFAEAYNNLGHALLDLGRFDEAAVNCRRAVDLKPEYAEAHDNLGSAQLARGRTLDALASYRRAVEIDPGFAEAHNNLGNAQLELGQLDAALTSYRRALAIVPDFAEAHNNLGNALRNLGQLDGAIASYRRALQINPLFAAAHSNLGIALRLKGRTAEAQASCRRALEIDPRLAEALLALAESSADQGEFVDAETLFKRAIAIESGSPEAWAGLARLRKMTRDDADWLVQAQRIADRPPPPRREICLRYAIGKYFDDVRDYEQAFSNFRRANELTCSRRAKFDCEQLTQTVDRIIQSYDQTWAKRPRGPANESTRPVFIVGMLRSGTTLAEQILASHPAVFGAGELTFWSAASAAPDGKLSALASDYLRTLHELSADAQRVVDKMPTNFAFLGPIHAALPNARIIHMRRHPLDTCLSIYFQHFETAISYANDLRDLAHYYGEYWRLMHHWRSTLPRNAILDVPYEALIEDHEAWSRRMLEFIGLPWDSRCLDFHTTKRTVMTASKWQVRQRVQNSSVGRWRNYAQFIAPLLPLEALNQ